MMHRILPLLLVLLLSVQSAMADPSADARAAALQLLEAVEGLAAARDADGQVAALTRTISAHETGLDALREGLAEIDRHEAVIAGQFDSQSVALSGLLGALMAVQRVEGPALLVHPSGPLGTARAGMLMADLAPAMQAEADRVAARLVELRDLRLLRAAALEVLSEGLASLQAAQEALGAAIETSREPPPPIGQDEARLLALLESAETLELLSAGLGTLLSGDQPAAESPAGSAAPEGFAQARGLLPLPVRGSLRPQAVQTGPDGTARPGLVLATADAALVTAPWSGTLRYRGALQDYGNVILLELGDGYLLLMAGLETVYPETGTIVSAGAPLGLMPSGSPAADQSATSPARTRALYMELRYMGQPIDPVDWFDLTGAAP